MPTPRPCRQPAGRDRDGEEELPDEEARPCDSPDLDSAIDKVIETYGKSERNKYRAVVYYMLVKHFGKEGVYA
jgi:hypothetical protein